MIQGLEEANQDDEEIKVEEAIPADQEEEKKNEEIEGHFSDWQAGAPIIASFSIVAGVALPADSPEVATGVVVTSPSASTYAAAH